MLTLYSVFHLNILFSSIAETERPAVIERAYWPLLRLVRESPQKIAIEAGGYTLEAIEALDPAWIRELRALIAEEKTELIGSGYAQIIGPLVPAEVTEHNLALGAEVYERLLGAQPQIAYINEQTYSAGLIPLYAGAGYRAVIMEWNNAARFHPEWDEELRYRVVSAAGTGNSRLPLLWNNSFAFQKFQRHAHNEFPLADYQGYLHSLLSADFPRFFALYGSDAEVFDYRPGRYKTEAFVALGEWQRITELYRWLGTQERFRTLLPREVLERAQAQGALPEVRLEVPAQPIIVKKQPKYNLARWAVTGSSDLESNTRCYRVYDALMRHDGAGGDSAASKPLWKELCYAWDSDFRTHITNERLSAHRASLVDLVRRVESLAPPSAPAPVAVPAPHRAMQRIDGAHTLHLSHPELEIVFNTRRGLSIESLIFPAISPLPLVCVLPHGHFEDITLGADFYSGNTTVEVPGRERITDLSAAHEVNVSNDGAGGTVVRGTIRTHAGPITKKITLYPEGRRLTLDYSFELAVTPPLSFRTGIMTLNPAAFNLATLAYSCRNGGKESEWFACKDAQHISTDPVSLLVSSGMMLGNTSGELELGDAAKKIILRTPMSRGAQLPMIKFLKTGDTFLFRAAYSLSEFDDTTALHGGEPLPRSTFFLELSAMAQ